MLASPVFKLVQHSEKLLSLVTPISVFRLGKSKLSSQSENIILFHFKISKAISALYLTSHPQQAPRIPWLFAPNLFEESLSLHLNQSSFPSPIFYHIFTQYLKWRNRFRKRLMRNCCISFLTNTLKIHGSFKQRKLAIASFYLQLKKAQLAFKNVKLLATL